MRLPKRKRPSAGSFTGSMADVSFLLVIFFMVTTVLAASRGLDLALPPEPGPDDVIEADEAVDSHVLDNGSLVVDRRPMGLAEVLPYVGTKLAVDPLKPVILRTDDHASYGAMMQVLDELRSAPEKRGFEIRNLAIPTKREMGRWY